MKKEHIAVILGIVGGLGIFSGITSNTIAIIVSVVVIFFLSGWLFNKLQKKEASSRTASNPITTNDQNAIGAVAFIVVLVFYCVFFYIGTLF